MNKGDLISKKEFNRKLGWIKKICSNWSSEEAIGEAFRALNSEIKTVDAVPVVRCKDCIFWGDKDGIQYNERLGKRCARCGAHNYEFNGHHWGWCPTEDDYCSFGEKKVEE